MESNRLMKSIGNKAIFSVIIPTYNQAHLLSEALESLISQTFLNWEAVVVNDGSTDNTIDVMNEYAKKDSRIKCYHKENGGTGSAINFGIENAKGEWICWLSSDDLFEPDKLEIQYEAIIQFPQIKFFYTHFYYLDVATKEKGTPDLWLPIPPRSHQVTQLLIGNYVNGISIACHESVFRRVGVFNTTFRQAQDYDMWLRITSKFESKFINRRTCVTRFHPGQDTNVFVEGMYYDSARSAIDFLNNTKFPEIFPLLNLNNYNHLSVAIQSTIESTLNLKSFMYRCGFMPILIDRLNEWICYECPSKLRDIVRSSIKESIQEFNRQFIPDEIAKAYERLLTNNKFIFTPYNFFENTLKYIDELLINGDQKTSKNLERYIYTLFNKRETKVLPYVAEHKEYYPKIYDYPKDNNYIKLPYLNLIAWKIEPLNYEGLFKHHIKIKCSNCCREIYYEETMLSDINAQAFKIICHDCHTAFEIFDSEIHKYLTENNKITKKAPPNKDQIKIAFLARGINGKSGGTKIYSKYIQWVNQAGISIKIISDSPKGKWFDPPGEFIQVKNFNEADLNDVDYVFLYSILDLSQIADKISFDRIIYVCQAYEGFLYGKDFNHLRTDKSMFVSLHSLPVKILSVSEHLHQFFSEVKNKKSFLVNNFIDTKIFRPKKSTTKIKNSILFVGNPFQPLKGFRYVLASIRAIQHKFIGENKLKFFVATGIVTDQMRDDFDKIKNVIDADVFLFDALSDEKVAELITSTEVYVCGSWYEGFSLSVLEAMACGVNVISTKNMGVESFCSDGINSFLVDYEDVIGLSNLLLNILTQAGKFSEIRSNAVKTASTFTEYNTKNVFLKSLSEITGCNSVRSYNIESAEQESDNQIENIFYDKNLFIEKKKLNITYLIDNILAVTGGNQTLLSQTNELVRRGHRVTIVTNSIRPPWFNLLADVRTIPTAVPLNSFVPNCDVVISTYIDNAVKLKNIKAPVKIYFHQGDQYIFNDSSLKDKRKNEIYHKESKAVFGATDIKLVANSKALANEIKSKYGKESDEIINVGVDLKIFKSIQKPFKGSKLRILVVGPDKKGTTAEPLDFKGIFDVKEALLIYQKANPDFTLIRISNSEPEVFKDFSCEFYFIPNDNLKTYLYGTADVLIYASHYESWGLPPLEAMAAGVPVICTSNVGSLEYCQNEENCLLVPIKSPKSIADALVRLFEDKSLHRKIIQGGLFTVQKFSKVNEWDALENMLYKFVYEMERTKLDLTEIKELVEDQLLLADQYLGKGEFELCIDSLSSISNYINDLLDVELKIAFYQSYGLSSIALLNTSDAKISFESLLLLSPSSSIACWGLGQLFLLENKNEQAKIMFEWAVKNNPGNLKAVEALKSVNTALSIPENHNSLFENIVEQVEVVK